MPLSSDDLDLLVEIARQDIALVGRLRAALEAGDDRRALSLARIIAGLTTEEMEVTRNNK
jgi:hypothetical protein